MSCPASIYSVNSEFVVGKDTKGNPVQFKGLPAYREYLAKLNLTGHPCPDVSFLPQATKPDAPTPFAGFMEFKPANPTQQAKYSAMSSTWVGSDDTNTAFEQGLKNMLSR
jgi:hypothetical protein